MMMSRRFCFRFHPRQRHTDQYRCGKQPTNAKQYRAQPRRLFTSGHQLSRGDQPCIGFMMGIVTFDCAVSNMGGIMLFGRRGIVAMPGGLG